MSIYYDRYSMCFALTVQKCVPRVWLQIKGGGFDPPSPRSHTFVEIDYEIISVVILLPSAESFFPQVLSKFI